MSIWLGIHRTTEVIARAVRRITPEIVQINCPECGGDGDWGKFLFEGLNDQSYAEAFGIQLPYVRGAMPCVDCKGTGRVYA